MNNTLDKAIKVLDSKFLVNFYGYGILTGGRTLSNIFEEVVEAEDRLEAIDKVKEKYKNGFNGTYLDRVRFTKRIG